MGANILLTIAASFLLLSSAVHGHATVESEVFHVAGKVLCQDCGEGWNEWVNGANPIKGHNPILVSLTIFAAYLQIKHAILESI